MDLCIMYIHKSISISISLYLHLYIHIYIYTYIYIYYIYISYSIAWCEMISSLLSFFGDMLICCMYDLDTAAEKNNDILTFVI